MLYSLAYFERLNGVRMNSNRANRYLQWLNRCLKSMVSLSISVTFPFSQYGYAHSFVNLIDILNNPPGRLAKLHVGDGIVYETISMNAFYSLNNYSPFWIVNSQFTSILNEVRNLLLKSSRHGLLPEKFWSASLENFFQQRTGMKENDFELAVSEALIRYVYSIHGGQVDPSLVDDDIKLERKKLSKEDLIILVKALQDNPLALEPMVESTFQPKSQLYYSLKKQLENENSSHSISTDQKSKIIATMEKLRWLPSDLGKKYAFVNLATTEIKVIEDKKAVLKFKTINGRPGRRTPMMIDEVRTIILNPTWTAPASLARFDKLSIIKANPDYLNSNFIKAYPSGSRTPIEDVHSVQWNNYSSGNFPFTLVQYPGPGNALGKVKFPLQNKFSIYLHDTNEPDKFREKSPRLLSSGCIRLEKPMEFAAFLLKDQIVPLGQGWKWKDGRGIEVNTKFNEEILMSRVAKKSSFDIEPIKVSVVVPLKLYTAYLTVDFLDEASESLQYAKDYYGQDERLLKLLENSKLTAKTSPINLVEKSSGQFLNVKVEGLMGPTQLFREVTAVRCGNKSYKGCLKQELDGKSKSNAEIYHFKVNEMTQLPAGSYMLGVENSLYSGWLNVSCQPPPSDLSSEKSNSGCAPLVVKLSGFSLPEEYSHAHSVLIYRDLSKPDEQQKILNHDFYLGNAFLPQASSTSSDRSFYLASENQIDMVQRMSLDYCLEVVKNKSSLSKTAGLFPDAIKNCQSFKDTLALKNITAQVKNFSKLNVYRFPFVDNYKTYALSDHPLVTGEWTQRWISAPGSWITFTHRRYLVAAPIFPGTTPREKQFVSVFPGDYLILALDGSGKPMGLPYPVHAAPANP